MRLRIAHHTEYRYDTPVAYALQRLRLTPRSSPLQTVLSWSFSVTGAKEEVRFNDQFENETVLVSVADGTDRIVVSAGGEVETNDRAGVFGEGRGFAPTWLFQRETALTKAGEGVEALVASIAPGPDLDRLHQLMAAIGEAVRYAPGTTHVDTTAEEALARGSGVCQDHTHVFSSAARGLGYPARYVSGYLMLDDRVDQVASHAWAEAYVPGLGWVGFDAANGVSPDDRYVRLAVGHDYRDAMPVSGIRLGLAEERLAVRITVEQ